MQYQENSLIINKHILLCINNDTNPELIYLKKNFCGIVNDTLDLDIFTSEKIIYMCGNIGSIYNKIKNANYNTLFVIQELSNNYDLCDKCKLINLGMVPLN